jgi:hypothetical protein
MMSAWRGSEASKNILKSLRGGIEWRTPGKIKYQTHRRTYRKRESLIQNLNQRTPSIVEYQTGRTTYMMIKICTGNS